MAKEIETNMRYKGMPVVISTGIGEKYYYVMAIKPNGSRKRILKSIKENTDPMVVLADLEKWVAEKAGNGTNVTHRTNGTKCLKPKA